MQVSYKKRKKKENSKITTFRKIKKKSESRVATNILSEMSNCKNIKIFFKKGRKEKRKCETYRQQKELTYS